MRRLPSWSTIRIPRRPRLAALALLAGAALWQVMGLILLEGGTPAGGVHPPVAVQGSTTGAAGGGNARTAAAAAEALRPLQALVPGLVEELAASFAAVLDEAGQRRVAGRPARAPARATGAAPAQRAEASPAAAGVQRAAASPPAALGTELFPVPKELATAVEFWRKVYAEYGRHHYLVHDRETLIVFAVLDLSNTPDHPRQRQRLLDAELKVYEKRLRRLGEKIAEGTPVEELPGDEQRWVAALKKLPERNAFSAASERLRVQRAQRDQFAAGLRRSGRWLDTMEAVFRREGLPVELCLLPHVESSFNYRAISKVGASGIWQFMPATGRMYMTVGTDLDERNDPMLATEAAARLLAKNYRYLGNWPLALTAYNHGLSGMMRAVRDTGSSDLAVILQKYSSRTFGFASKNFYSEFVAAKEVAQNHTRYFPGLTFDAPHRLDSLSLPRPMTLAAVGKALDLDADELADLNPAFGKSIRKSKRSIPKGYSLRLPHRPGEDWAAVLDGRPSTPPTEAPADPRILLAAVQDAAPAVAAAAPPAAEPEASTSMSATPGTSAAAGSTQTPASAAASAAKRSARPRVHTVRQGDTLGALALRYNTSVKSIVRQNKLRSAHRLKIGQRLRIPN